MSRKIRIASTLALVGALLTVIPAAALAGSPLLSGYGGPGAGEQAIIGSTLLNGPRGGAGSGGSAGGSQGSTGASGEGSGDAGTTNGSAQVSGGAASSSAGASSSKSPSKAAGSNIDGTSQVAGHGGGSLKRVEAYVYPSSLASASSDTSVIGITGGDVLLFVGAIAMLALVGALTVRLSRLQT